MAFDDQFAGEGIFSISSSEGFNTLGSVDTIKLSSKDNVVETLDGDPFRFFQKQILKVNILDTGKNTIDILENSIDNGKADFFILGSPSVLFKNSRFKYKIKRDWIFNGRIQSIELETSTEVKANFTGSIRNLLGESGSCQDSVGGLAPGLLQDGPFGTTTNIQGSASFNLTSAIDNGQRLEHTASNQQTSYAWKKVMPCSGDISLAFEFDVIAVDNDSGFNTFIRLLDLAGNTIKSVDFDTILADGQQARIELRGYFRNVTEQIVTLQCGFSKITGEQMDLFMDNFQLEYGVATPFVPR